VVCVVCRVCVCVCVCGVSCVCVCVCGVCPIECDFETIAVRRSRAELGRRK